AGCGSGADAANAPPDSGLVKATQDAGLVDQIAADAPGRDGASGASQLALGTNVSCLVSGGVAKCWGSNSTGMLGDGTTTDRSRPTAVVGLGPVTFVSPRQSYTCALLASGAIDCWGSGSHGSLGDGTTSDSATPVGVLGITSAVGLATGPVGSHSCAILVNSEVSCWGLDSSYQLVSGDLRAVDATQPVVGELTGAMKVVVGSDHTCGLRPDGFVLCGGGNGHSETGGGIGATGSNFAGAHLEPYLGSSVDIAAGYNYTCVVLTDGTAECWGDDSYSELGDGRLVGSADGGGIAPQAWPTQVVGLSNAVKIVAGVMHTCALLADGTVSCWGTNAYGQIGDGRIGERVGPTPVVGLSGVKQIAVGWMHTCALLEDESVECWGDNTFGELGDGTTTSRLVPTRVQF
ncbi:MAG: RCC1 domain-containing protein, partial [Polyangiaceae bacterium]